ncbi:GLPGLI family protein [uncultured Mucilaginibacter sp.]|uniref:GLPGLI family protein n=1 Tax=uncultured Mucilaginibacter sp. TaxID=797541 RepID=UPI0025E70F5B|nr:GLPGLI family protein [uncultured Mucilaginibacter sp.]
MKKQLLLCAALLTAAITAGAQNTDTAAYMVHYKFSHVRDTTNRANPYTENMALLLGKISSVYKSYDKQLQDALFKKQVKEAMANSPDGNIKINRQNTGSPLQYFQFPAQQKLYRKESLVINSYLIEDALPKIDWKVSSDTASFGGMHCQKATAHFKGRDYTAWFCADMPFHAGPWKLNGLPGVILEAYDAKKEVVFKFDGIEKVAPPQTAASAATSEAQPGDGHRMIVIGGDDADTDPAIIALPSRSIKTTDKEFTKLQEAMRKDPDAFVQAMMASSGMNGPGNGPRPQIKIKIGPQPVINNPVELAEK